MKFKEFYFIKFTYVLVKLIPFFDYAWLTFISFVLHEKHDETFRTSSASYID